MNPERSEGADIQSRERFSGGRFTLLRGILIVFEDAPVAAVLRALVAVAAGAATGPLLVLATERFIATALEVASGGLPLADVAAPVLVLLALFTAQILETVVRGLADARIEMGLRRGFRTDLTEKRARLEYRYVEDPDTADLLRRVASGPQMESRPAPERGPTKQTFDDGVALVAIAVRVLGIAVVLARLEWWIVPVVMAVMVPFVFLGVRSGRRLYEFERRVAHRRRRAEYLSEEVLQGRDAAAERTLFGYTSYVNARWRTLFDPVIRLQALWNLRSWLQTKSAALLIIVAIIIAMLAFLQPLQAGVIDVAFYVAAVTALLQAQRTISQQLVDVTSRLAQHREYFVDLQQFADLDETRRSLTRRAPEHTFKSIEFEDVRFRYPGTDVPVLDGISFRIQAGQHYALVGANGSGKSTITKLMLGLYPPTGGRIAINDIPSNEWSQEALNGLFGVVFQDFVRYSLTVRDNIALGSLSSEEDSSIAASLELAGLNGFVKHLPRGYETPLGKVLAGGVDVSGGQWQRLAVARSLASEAPVRILDEPTAALDPLAESEVYESYSRVSAGLTTLFISHRLGSTKIADRILVIHEGTIKESGTHDRLMQEGGVYAQMFEAQESWYAAG